MLLNELPNEIFHLIIQQLDQTELRQVRLVNKAWSSVATKSLFNAITMTPTIKGLELWNGVMRHDKLRCFPTKATINSCPIPDWEPWNYTGRSPEHLLMDAWWPTPEEDEYAGFYKAIGDVGRIPNLNGAVLRFTGNCVANEEDSFTTGVETVEYRLSILETFFAKLQNRVKKQKFSPVESLTIHNLQNMPLPDFTYSADFRQVLSSVDRLHLQICEEYNEHGPDNDINCEERRTFMPYLVDHWLMPVAAQLRTLTLFFPDCWGPLPGYFDGSSLDFPVLQTLNLGRYCLAHDDSFDWVLRQKSLRTLRMYACAIASYFRLTTEDVSEWEVRTHDWTKVPDGSFGMESGDDEIYHYPGVWSKVLASIPSHLSQLENFRFQWDERGIWNPTSFFDRPDLLGVKLSTQRYTAFDIGILPSQWVDAESSGELAIAESEGINVHEQNVVKDQEALNLLLDELSMRRQRSQHKS